MQDKKTWKAIGSRTRFIVYGAMSKKWLLRVFLLYFNLLGYFASSNPPLPESSCRQFLLTHLWRPFRISKWPLFPEYYRIEYQLMQANYDCIPQIRMFFDFKCKAIKCHNFLLPNMAIFSVFKMAANVTSEILLFFNSSFAIIF